MWKLIVPFNKMLKGKSIVSELSDADDIRDQLINLQSQLAFQEDTVQSLNSIVIEQQQQIERLNEMINLVKSQMEMAVSGDNNSVVDVPPPHY